MIPEIAGALITGGTSLLSGLGNLLGVSSSNSANRQINQDTIDYDKWKTIHQENWSSRMYERYQSIPAQVRQLKEAGINPSMAMTNPSVGQLPTAPSGGAPSSIPMQSINYGEIAQGLGGAVNSYFANKQTEALARKTSNEADIEQVNSRFALTQKMLDVAKRMQELDKGSLAYKAAKEELDYLSSVRDDMRSKLRWDTKTQEALYNNYKANTDKIRNDIATSNIMTKLALNADSRAALQLKSDLAEAKARIDNMVKAGKLTDVQVRHEVEKMAKTIVEKYGQQQRNVINSLDVDRTNDIMRSRGDKLFGVMDDLLDYLGDVSFGKLFK